MGVKISTSTYYGDFLRAGISGTKTQFGSAFFSWLICIHLSDVYFLSEGHRHGFLC